MITVATAQSLLDRNRPIEVAPLDDSERSFVATVVAAFSHPALVHVRRRLRSGHLALCIENGEVTWVDCDHGATRALAQQGRRGA